MRGETGETAGGVEEPTTASGEAIDAGAVAREATRTAFLNCYLREAGGEFVNAQGTPIDAPESGLVARCGLERLGVELLTPVAYRAPTGRHLFDGPTRARFGGGEPVECDYATLAALVVRDLSLARDGAGDELLRRVLLSCRNVERFVEARADDEERLYGLDFDLLDAEQSLVFGHLLHPTPKSRQGMSPREEGRYAPELRGRFPLYYVRADPDLVVHDSARDESAVEWVKRELRSDPEVPDEFVAEHVESDDALLPLHPWQARRLLDRPAVGELVEAGRLEPLGEVGRAFAPTTSVRTLYHPDASFMAKGSLDVRITNSRRVNKRPELDRGVAVSELLDTELGDDLAREFPDFGVVRDPAYLTLDVDDGRDAPESGFEVVLRENPFRGDDARSVAPVVALCQDRIGGGRSRLGAVVAALADREGRSFDAVAEEWFRRYLAISVRPLLWLYLERGIGLEAHQQNSLLRLDGGYPDAFYYRDNQGYYFPEAIYGEVDRLLPGVGERADTICPDAVADERIRYYVVLNNAFGVANALGVAGADERRLLAALREELERATEYDRPTSSLVTSLLSEPTVPCKANLLTRFHDMDELVGSLDDQSVYAEIENPLVTEPEVSVE
nr:IucA/IucC family protein [Halomarina sp. PSR21]